MKKQLLLLLVVGELAARLLSPYRHVPSATESVSNPLGRRGWPEYLAKTSDAPTIILISNSQAQGLDTEDPAARYVGLMQAQLATTPMRLENWGSEGILTGELEILTAKAMRRAPALVVYVVGVNNFDVPERVSLARAGSDIGILAGNPLLWPALSGTLLWKGSHVHDFLYRSVLASSALARDRIVIEDALATTLPKPMQRATFGRILDLRPGGLKSPQYGSSQAVQAMAQQEPERSVEEAPAVRDLAALIGRTKTTRVLWVWMPAAIGGTSPRLVRDALDLATQTAPALEAAGVQVENFTLAFGDNEFLTQFHLNKSGHHHMAEVLLPRVLNALR